MRLLASPVFWMGAIVFAGTVLYFLMGDRRKTALGFREMVNNVDEWRRVTRMFDEIDAEIDAAKSWDDDQVAASTRKFILETTSSGESWTLRRILTELGDRTHPTVLGLLRDQSRYNELVKLIGESRESPFHRACELLCSRPPADAVELLAPFLNDPSSDIREEAALTIGKAGTASILPLMKKAFSDEEDGVQEYALMGLQFATQDAGIADEIKSELFPGVLALLKAERDAETAAEILIYLNADKALEFFLSEDVFEPKSPILVDILKALVITKTTTPREKLQVLIDSLNHPELKYPQTYALGYAFRSLGQHQRPEDREMLRRGMNYPNDSVATGAAEGLIYSYRLDGFRDRISETERGSGYDSLTARQKFYSSVMLYDAEVNNGGFDQYFFNSSGDHWQDALAGMKAMGFQERLAVFQEALAKFGADGPSTDRDERHEQLSAINTGEETVFRSLEERYYKNAEVVDVYLLRFVLDHPEDFR